MARYFTSAQLTLFRSALALLDDAILQGDLDVVDQKYVDPAVALVAVTETLVSDQTGESQALESGVTTTNTLSAGKETSQPKSKSFFSWFSKKKPEVATPPPVDLSRIKVESAPVIADKVVAKTEVVVPPSEEVAKPATPPDTRIVSSFFTGLPWAFKKESSELVSSVPSVPAQAKDLSSDNRIVSSYFPTLPWLQKPKEGAQPKQATNVITIDRKASADDSGSVSNRSVLVTAQYFSGLPWAIKGQAQPTQHSTGLEVDSPPQSDIASATSALTDYKLEFVDSFFANAPWSQPKHDSGNGQSDKLSTNQGLVDQQDTPLETAQVVNLSIPLDDYFPTLPWQGQGASKNTDSANASGSGGEGVPSIFAAATQSALHASRKDKKPGR
jgi:hypothetical protein